MTSRMIVGRGAVKSITIHRDRVEVSALPYDLFRFPSDSADLAQIAQIGEIECASNREEAAMLDRIAAALSPGDASALRSLLRGGGSGIGRVAPTCGN